MLRLSAGHLPCCRRAWRLAWGCFPPSAIGHGWRGQVLSMDRHWPRTLLFLWHRGAIRQAGELGYEMFVAALRPRHGSRLIGVPFSGGRTQLLGMVDLRERIPVYTRRIPNCVETNGRARLSRALVLNRRLHLRPLTVSYPCLEIANRWLRLQNHGNVGSSMAVI